LLRQGRQALALLPDLSTAKPYISISGHGLAIWFTTPLLFFLLWPRERTAIYRPLLLTAALEQAKPGDLILMVSYGDGADAVLLRATERLAQYRTALSLFAQIERKRLLPSYGKYARFRRLIKTDTGSDELSTPVVLFRDRRTVLSLHGGKCPSCGTVQFPRHVVCIECGHRDGLDEVKLARRGTLFTFTNDYIHDSPDAPTTHGVVELDGGARVYVQLTDVDADQVEVDMPVELTFRKYHEGSGIQNYFWKARPAAGETTTL